MKKYLIYPMMAAVSWNFPPGTRHLTGERLTSGRINEQNTPSWLKKMRVIK